MLIVCGSATSWIINHMLKERKGFHNRVTRRIRLLPFTLRECEELLENNGIVMTREQTIECYMVFGGIPYYLNLIDSRLSLAQNIDELMFKPYGDLKDEYDELFYMTLISANGLAKGKYASVFLNVITGDQLFSR